MFLLAGSLVPAPEAAGSWKEWGAALKAAASGSPQGAARPGAGAVRAALQRSLAQLEEALLAQSVGGLDGDGEPSASEAAGSEGVGERQDGGEGEGSPAARSREQVGRGKRALRASGPGPPGCWHAGSQSRCAAAEAGWRGLGPANRPFHAVGLPTFSLRSGHFPPGPSATPFTRTTAMTTRTHSTPPPLSCTLLSLPRCWTLSMSSSPPPSGQA